MILETLLETGPLSKENITVDFSSVYIVSIKPCKNSFILFWDKIHDRAFGYSYDKIYYKILSNKMLKSTIYSKSFFIRKVVWKCETCEELESHITDLIKSNDLILFQRWEIS